MGMCGYVYMFVVLVCGQFGMATRGSTYWKDDRVKVRLCEKKRCHQAAHLLQLCCERKSGGVRGNLPATTSAATMCFLKDRCI